MPPPLKAATSPRRPPCPVSPSFSQFFILRQLGFRLGFNPVTQLENHAKAFLEAILADGFASIIWLGIEDGSGNRVIMCAFVFVKPPYIVCSGKLLIATMSQEQC
ncbi:GM18766 [Drosophila sechellia]|uniref:GM18766 n=1 Tax=Drosophila sechellia TaxID=7238 RepID=B4HWY2_DROSE|nr:GM18766 [Drosophila sechellia]